MTFLTACGTSPPPFDEFADEVIDSAEVSDDVKQCMHGKWDDFELTADERTAANLGENGNLEDAFERADGAETPPATNQQGSLTDEARYAAAAGDIVARLKSELESCQ